MGKRPKKCKHPVASIPRKASSPHSIIIITPPNVIIVPRLLVLVFLVYNFPFFPFLFLFFLIFNLRFS
ncbi:hypothetical protein BDV37DRAFT_257044 [Aspergillus pseudonomiae]|uniref:Transmembrane protein n=1 Tax=Aspergillus pseudonomiae TaxID=1506151 RepID=A0A5N7D4P4_9EURO|nr:uncharacterized protein BDV37DRAFT_257044 [Aspergillus pseudonomiae]KAE8400758.1 hypothetical protein BDV37DRAFT_257044 [Aspergillus pseudonomiae]